MTLLEHHVLALSLTAFTTFALGILVLLSDPKERLNQIFGLYSLVISAWAVAECFVFTATDASRAARWSYLVSWPAVILIGPTFLHSVFLSIGRRDLRSKVVVRAAYLLSVTFFLMHFVLPGTLSRPPALSSDYPNFRQDLSLLGSLVPVTFLIFVNLALWNLWRAYSSSSGQRRTQLKYLFWASVIGYAGGAPDWLIIYERQIPIVSPFGLYGIPCYSLATTYAVLQHKLFNVNLVIRRSLVYSMLVTVLTIGYFGLIHMAERLFQITFGYRSEWISLPAFAVMALVSQPLKFGIQRIVDFLFFKTPHEELMRRMERLEHEVRNVDKHRAVSTLAAGMAHEIKNPLTSLKTFTEYLSERGDDPVFQQKFRKVVIQEVERIDQIVKRLLAFAKPAKPQLQQVELSQILDETLEFMNAEALRRRVEIERDYRDQGTIQADPQQLRQVFLNLFLNSIEAVNGTGGKVSITTTRQGSRITVAIHDTGRGIAKENLGRVFDPFFTTKSNGTGLGLSVVQSILTEHHSTIAFESHPNHGTTCTLTFPLLI
jgi:signal transduction histidine kinase